jgi:hypothetical protein
MGRINLENGLLGCDGYDVGTYGLHLEAALKMKAIGSSETLMPIYKTK